ncbi:neurexin protein binding [Homalodisca vitripennis]|nr:neurexin protein binding [Homalodisca vitripennis]
MFVNNLYSHHLTEIFSAVRNEYSEWNETADTPLIVRDSLLLALSDGLTAAPLVKLAYLHSRRGSTTYLFHLSHQVDKDLRSLVRNTDPNSPGAEPDYENDKGGTNTWDMYEPVKQLYLAIGEVTEVQSHYRGHKMALWLNLIQQLLNSENDFLSYREFEGDEDNLYAGVVRPKTFTRPPTPTPTVTTPQGQDCVWNTTSVERPLPPPLQDVFRLTGPWGVTFAIGCLLLLCNLLLFASVYRRHFRTKNSFELRYRAAADGSCPEERLIAKSQSAPELATTSFLSERTSPKVLKRSQNKSSV